MESGNCIIDSESRVFYMDKAVEGVAGVLSEDIRRVFGVAVDPVLGKSPRPGDIILRMVDEPQLGVEGYRIKTRDRALIDAAEVDGLFAGAMTLLQSMSVEGGKLSTPMMAIEDEPFRPFRALMVDVKGKWHSVAQIENFVDLCRFYKVRYISLHTGEPQWMGAVMKSTSSIPAAERAKKRLYTQEEMDSLIAYGKARGVYFIPHNEVTETFAGMRVALQTDYNTKDQFPNYIQEVYSDEGIDFGKGNSEGLDGVVATDGAGVDDMDPDYWKVMKVLKVRSFAQFAAGFPGGKLPYYHMGPVHGEGGTHPDNAVKVLDILRELDPDVKLMFWNGPNAAQATKLKARQDETMVCFYSKSSSSSDVFAYLKNGWPIVNSAWSPLYVVGDSVARTQQQVFEDWNTFRSGTDGFTGSGFVYDGIDWDEFDTEANQAALFGGMLCTWGPSASVHLDRVRLRLPAFAEHAWHHKPWPYPESDYPDFKTRYLAVDKMLGPFLGLTAMVPDTPQKVKASNGTVAKGVRIKWQGSSGFPDGYRVLRGNSNKIAEAKLVSGDLFDETYLDGDVVANTPYYYWVVAYNEKGGSAPAEGVMGSAGDGIARTSFYEGFEYPAGSNISGQIGGSGWATPWKVTVKNPGILEAVKDSLAYSTLPVRGGALRVHPTEGGSGFEFERDMKEAIGSGGTTLWFSFLLRGAPVSNGHVFINFNKVAGGQVGKKSGGGFAFNNNPAGIRMQSEKTYFVVVRYDFKDGADDLHMWLNPSLDAEPDIAKAAHSTSGVDMGSGTNMEVQVRGYGMGDYLLDEFRMGASWAEARGADQAGDPNDAEAPVPNPMEWNVPPFAKGADAISMLAATASDPNGVEYFFEEVSGNQGGSNSGWQSDTAYTDTGLKAGTEYTYRVKVRDRSGQDNRTDWSPPLSASTGDAKGD